MSEVITNEQALGELARRNARDNFWAFCLFHEYDFFMEREYPLKDFALMLNEAYYSTKKKYMASAEFPPRTGKSTTLNYFTAWCIAKSIKNSVIRVSYSQKLSTSLNSMVKSILANEKTAYIFPEILDRTPVKDTETTLKYKEHHRESLYATSVGGSVTGLGGNIILLDDVYKDHIEACTDSINNKTIEWYESALQSRLDQYPGKILFVGTRWRVGELVDKYEKAGELDRVLRVAALKDDDTSFNENIHPTETLLSYKNTFGEHIFQSMYQQEPMLSVNGLVKLDDFRYISEEDFAAAKVRRRIAFVDPKGGGSDSFAVALLAITDIGIILEDCMTRTEVLDLELAQETELFLRAYGPEVFVETNKEYFMYQTLKKRLPHLKVKGRHTGLNKISKLDNSAYLVKQVILRQTSNPEYTHFLMKMCAYDSNATKKKDDELDAITMAVRELAAHPRKYGIQGMLITVQDKEESEVS